MGIFNRRKPGSGSSDPLSDAIKAIAAELRASGTPEQKLAYVTKYLTQDWLIVEGERTSRNILGILERLPHLVPTLPLASRIRLMYHDHHWATLRESVSFSALEGHIPTPRELMDYEASLGGPGDETDLIIAHGAGAALHVSQWSTDELAEWVQRRPAQLLALLSKRHPKGAVDIGGIAHAVRLPIPLPPPLDEGLKSVKLPAPKPPREPRRPAQTKPVFHQVDLPDAPERDADGKFSAWASVTMGSEQLRAALHKHGWAPDDDVSEGPDTHAFFRNFPADDAQAYLATSAVPPVGLDAPADMGHLFFMSLSEPGEQLSTIPPGPFSEAWADLTAIAALGSVPEPGDEA